MARVFYIESEPEIEQQTTSDDWLRPQLTPNAQRVLERRYLRKNETSQVCETPGELFQRVARNIAQAETCFDKNADTEKWTRLFYEMMVRLEFVPNSPTLMNAGRELQQLSACFVLPVEDSIDSIFEIVKNTALIHKSGGGTGFSFSRLRPKNDIVSTSHGFSSGPISFMKVFNEATEAINQGGFRRGANMAILDYNHPDILEFITSKVNETALNNFNISVGVTEEFMRKAEKDEEYDLVNPRTKQPTGRLRARQVFDLIVDMAWKSGEPGIVFLDRLNRDNPTPQTGRIESTNPCGEQPLLPYESCNLGSINLSTMVNQNGIDFKHLRRIVHLAVRFLDNVVERNRYPLPMIEQMTKMNRKIGLGVMGFADMLIKLGVPYNSEEALQIGEGLMKSITQESKLASQELAKERGPFPAFSNSIYALKGEPPLRNATTSTIAPTGTISIIAGTSSGIEPLYGISFVRNVMDGTKLLEVHPIFEAIAKREGFHSKKLMEKTAQYNSIKDLDKIPAEIKRIFVTAHDITPPWHIRMQSAFQKHTDNAVSKTVNFRHEATREDVAEVYFLAYQTGCKGATIYRDGCRQKQVLTTVQKAEPQPVSTATQTLSATPRPRPEVTSGTTHKIKTGCGNLYVTINYDEEGNPFELFSTMGKAGGCAASQAEAISRLISFALRSRASVKEVVKQLKGISCHSISWSKGGKILSCADAIAKALESSLKHTFQIRAASGEAKAVPVAPALGEATLGPGGARPDGRQEKISKSASLRKGACPECGGILTYEEGCALCYACGFTECG